MSDQFKALVLNQEGDNFTREVKSVDKSFLKHGDVTIKVDYSDLNFKDGMILKNGGRLVKEFPHIPGIDFAGKVLESENPKFKVGDEVYGCAGGIAGTDGALADYMLVDTDLMALKPKSLSMREAAALPLVSITAWEALHDKLQIKAGDNVLIHGATGGVGHIAIQLAKYFGATVSATSTPRNIALAVTLGADHIINATEESVDDYVNHYTSGIGFDAVFDTVAGDNIQKSFQAVKLNGGVATILPVEDVLQVALKSLSFHSVLMLIPLVHGLNRVSHGKILAKIAELVDEEALKPLLDEQEFTLWQVADAHAYVESGKAVGKVVLTAE